MCVYVYGLHGGDNGTGIFLEPIIYMWLYSYRSNISDVKSFSYSKYSVLVVVL